MKRYIATGKITPKYKGYFVSFWKKIDGVNSPYNVNEVKLIHLKTENGDAIIDKQYLIDKKILKSDKSKGKLGFRITEEDFNKRKLQQGLMIIDIQNDYFDKFKLWNCNNVLKNTIKLVKRAQEKNIPIFIIEHHNPLKDATLLAKNSDGAKTHNELMDALNGEEFHYEKMYASALTNEKLLNKIKELEINNLYIGGMMTQNCVTHSALDHSIGNIDIKIVEDISTTVDQTIHNIAIRAFKPYLDVLSMEDIEF